MNPARPQALGYLYVHLSQLFLLYPLFTIQYLCFKFSRMSSLFSDAQIGNVVLVCFLFFFFNNLVPKSTYYIKEIKRIYPLAEWLHKTGYCCGQNQKANLKQGFHFGKSILKKDDLEKFLQKLVSLIQTSNRLTSNWYTWKYLNILQEFLQTV